VEKWSESRESNPTNIKTAVFRGIKAITLITQKILQRPNSPNIFYVSVMLVGEMLHFSESPCFFGGIGRTVGLIWRSSELL